MYLIPKGDHKIIMELDNSQHLENIQLTNQQKKTAEEKETPLRKLAVLGLGEDFRLQVVQECTGEHGHPIPRCPH